MIESTKLKYDGVKGIPYMDKPGSARKVHTGTWRVFKPVWDMKKCIKCMQCWLYCPESAIAWKSLPRVDYHTCKGCGICAQVCPSKAIEMVRDTHEGDEKQSR